MMPDAAHLYAVIDATWPAASQHQLGPWLVRDGQGGGQRVCSTLAVAPVTVDDLPAAENAMQALGQPLIFMIREGETALDKMLEAAGYSIVDPVNLYVTPVSELATQCPPRLTTFDIWEPLAIMREIWTRGGIGPRRLAVMERANCIKTGLLGRANNRPAATGYVAIHDRVAMVHALEVLPDHRRAGMGRYMMRQAAFWAMDNGATHMSVLCTQANVAANALYSSLGLTLVGHYHYRNKRVNT